MEYVATYLNDHLAGSVVALELLECLEKAHAGKPLERMEQRGSRGQIPEFLSDHPSGAHRIHDFQTWVPQAIAGKKAFDEGKIAPAGAR